MALFIGFSFPLGSWHIYSHGTKYVHVSQGLMLWLGYSQLGVLAKGKPF